MAGSEGRGGDRDGGGAGGVGGVVMEGKLTDEVEKLMKTVNEARNEAFRQGRESVIVRLRAIVQSEEVINSAPIKRGSGRPRKNP